MEYKTVLGTLPIHFFSNSHVCIQGKQSSNNVIKIVCVWGGGIQLEVFEGCTQTLQSGKLQANPTQDHLQVLHKCLGLVFTCQQVVSWISSKPGSGLLQGGIWWLKLVERNNWLMPKSRTHLQTHSGQMRSGILMHQKESRTALTITKRVLSLYGAHYQWHGCLWYPSRICLPRPSTSDWQTSRDRWCYRHSPQPL